MVNVKFTARISTEKTAKLSFVSRRTEHSASAAALVFNLTSTVTERRSEKQFDMSTCLYETA